MAGASGSRQCLYPTTNCPAHSSTISYRFFFLHCLELCWSSPDDPSSNDFKFLANSVLGRSRHRTRTRYLGGRVFLTKKQRKTNEKKDVGIEKSLGELVFRHFAAGRFPCAAWSFPGLCRCNYVVYSQNHGCRLCGRLHCLFFDD